MEAERVLTPRSIRASWKVLSDQWVDTWRHAPGQCERTEVAQGGDIQLQEKRPPSREGGITDVAGISAAQPINFVTPRK